MAGATLWLTGLPAAGKTTLARALEARLGGRAVRLDGDEVRATLCADLGFSPADRHENVRRVAAAACEAARRGDIAVVALVSPYAEDRDRARAVHAAAGVRFIEVHVATPLAVCEERDPKGLYARARAGELPEMTGVDAPYEPPEHPEVVVRPGLDGDGVDEVLAVLERA